MRLIALLPAFFTIAIANPIAGPEPGLVKRATCPANGAVATPSPTGPGPKATPDTPAGFQSYSVFAAAATNAPVPSKYKKAFTNRKASTDDDDYLTFYYLESYDSNECAARCAERKGCKAFNIYFERAPVNSCPNPASSTFIKCALYGSSITDDTATNSGQMVQKFNVTIAGSNGYNIK